MKPRNCRRNPLNMHLGRATIPEGVIKQKSHQFKVMQNTQSQNLSYKCFDNNVEKLDEIEQHMCDGILTEHELATALKDMKKSKKTLVIRTYNRVLQTFVERH